MIQKQAEHTILNRHRTLQAQQTQCNKDIKEHQQNTTTLTKNYEELKTEITQIKQTYAEITTNSEPPQQNTQQINENTNMENMAKELTALKALVDMLHDNDLNNTVTITNLQKENKQLHQKIDKLQQQHNRKPIPHVEDATNLQQNINDTCITILKLITIPLITQTFIHKQTITDEKVMTKRIITTAKDLINKQTNIRITSDDIDITDSEDNISYSETSETESSEDENENHKDTTNSND